MAEEADLIRRTDAADADELAELLRSLDPASARRLRAALGDEVYQRLRAIAVQLEPARQRTRPRGNVVVVPDLFGSALVRRASDGTDEPVWVRARALIGGSFERLRLDEHAWGNQASTVAVGVLKRPYGELLLTLASGWTVRTFAYDWRRDLSIAAAQLGARVREWFPRGEPVSIVAHGVGGLVARAFLASQTEEDRRGGRLVMLGTPNHGCYVGLRMLAGLDPGIASLATMDGRSREDIAGILSSFDSLYETLPAPDAFPGAETFYVADTYGALMVPQERLDRGRRFHEGLHEAEDLDAVVVGGDRRRTPSSLEAPADWTSDSAYSWTLDGDGCVPHHLVAFRRRDEPTGPDYRLVGGHGSLPSNPALLEALDDLLETGTSERLHTAGGPERAPVRSSRRRATTTGDRVMAMATRGDDAQSRAFVAGQERELVDAVTRTFLSPVDDDAEPAVAPPSEPTPAVAPPRGATVTLRLLHGRIDDATLPRLSPPIDVLAVGHYIGVKPENAEGAVDEAISRTIAGTADRDRIDEEDLILTQYAQRGILRGGLAEPFFLPDPRTPGAERLVAVVGMGPPGRFGTPECAVVARELCWSLGRIGRRHLATVAIGAGNGNLPIADAIDAWIRGIKYAVTGCTEDEERLRCITFVESDPGRVVQIDRAIERNTERLRRTDRLQISYEPLSPRRRERLLAEARRSARDAIDHVAGRTDLPAEDPDGTPTRLTVELEGSSYRFGAITKTASVPEREVPLNPGVVAVANDELAAEWDEALQFDRGRFLGQLLIPDDLVPHLQGAAPLVMLLDARTARVHWEMLVPPVPERDGADTLAEQDGDAMLKSFLGTSRGFTRQLRTQFAPPPDPPLPPRRRLRVLIVADPAADMRLPEAEREGAEVAALFRAFNTVHAASANRVEVVRMLGPEEATRSNVLRELLNRTYDVLHFAGHCVYDLKAPAESGWLFTGGERLAVNELNRVDRIPKFVFSNACESGVTGDGERSPAGLAPTFAEAFFARGVSNFVCTAWPVNDTAARLFALELYAALLGVRPGDVPGRYAAGTVQPMYAAMRDARQRIWSSLEGAMTWGAYQHYGDPLLRLFDPRHMQERDAAGAAAASAPDRATATGLAEVPAHA